MRPGFDKVIDSIAGEGWAIEFIDTASKGSESPGPVRVAIMNRGAVMAWFILTGEEFRDFALKLEESVY